MAHVGEAIADGERGVVEDGDCAVGGCCEAGDELEERGFSGAVFAEENDAGAGGKRQRDLAEGGEGAVEARDAIEEDDGFGDGRCGHRCYASIGQRQTVDSRV